MIFSLLAGLSPLIPPGPSGLMVTKAIEEYFSTILLAERSLSRRFYESLTDIHIVLQSRAVSLSSLPTSSALPPTWSPASGIPSPPTPPLERLSLEGSTGTTSSPSSPSNGLSLLPSPVTDSTVDNLWNSTPEPWGGY